MYSGWEEKIIVGGRRRVFILTKIMFSINDADSPGDDIEIQVNSTPKLITPM